MGANSDRERLALEGGHAAGGSGAPAEKAAPAKYTYHLYVIEITERWYSTVARDIQPGKRCYYVGETTKDPRERLFEHLTGHNSRNPERTMRSGVFARMRGSKPGALQCKVDAILRKELAAPYNDPPLMSRDESEAAEARAIADLRAEGHFVYPLARRKAKKNKKPKPQS